MSRFDRAPFWIALPVSTLIFLHIFLAADSRRSPEKKPVNRTVAGPEATRCVDWIWEYPTWENPDAPVLAGLDWLARHQFSDGMWSSRGFFQMCPGTLCLGKGGEYDAAVTALAVLAILESGFAEPVERGGKRLFTEAAVKGLGWLAARQDDQGCFGPRGWKYLYGHSMATIAFCRAFTVLGDPLYKHHARRGAAFLESARNPGRGWRYGVRDGENDSSVTVWAGAALAAAEAVDIEISGEARRGTLAWLDEMTGPAREVSCQRVGGGSCSIRGTNDHFDASDTLTAMAAAVRVRLGVDRADPRVAECARRLSWNLPVWNKHRTSVDFYYWYAGTLALSVSGGEARRTWCDRVRWVLGRAQRQDGCCEGSWDPVDKWGSEGGRVYATALNVLTLSLAR